MGYQALRADRENDHPSFDRDFLTETNLYFETYGVGEDNYQGVPITAHDYGNLGRFEYLPDGSLFRDPVYGGILNVNAEEWIYRAGGADPGWLDPINWSAGYGTAKALGYSADVRLYRGAKGFGFNIYQNKERVLGIDAHLLGKKGHQWWLPHLDSKVHGFSHWPWSIWSKNFRKGR